MGDCFSTRSQMQVTTNHPERENDARVTRMINRKTLTLTSNRPERQKWTAKSNHESAIAAANRSQNTITSQPKRKAPQPPTQNTRSSNQQTSSNNQGGLPEKTDIKVTLTVSDKKRILATDNDQIKQSGTPVATVAPFKSHEQTVNDTPESATIGAGRDLLDTLEEISVEPAPYLNAPNILPESSNADENTGTPVAKRPSSYPIYATEAESSQSYDYKLSAALTPTHGVAQTSHYEAKTTKQTHRFPEWKYTGVLSTPLTSGLPDEQESSATGNWRYRGSQTEGTEDLNGQHYKPPAFKRNISWPLSGSRKRVRSCGGDASQPVEAVAEVKEARLAGHGQTRSGDRLPTSYVNMPSGTKVSITIPKSSACNCLTPGANLQLLTLEPNSKLGAREYDIVTKEMHETMKHHNYKSYNIEKIHKVINCCLWKKFRQREREIAAEAGYVNERMLFHGSPAADDIVRTGFDMSQAKGGYFGQGVYFAQHSSKSNQYAGYVGYKQMLFCRVALGKMHKLKFAEVDYKGLPPGYHSVEGKLQVPEYVVYNDDQAYPEFLVQYDIVT